MHKAANHVRVFLGRILKDEDTLSQHGVTSGNVLHLVKGAKAGQPTDTPAATTTAAPAHSAAAPAHASVPGGTSMGHPSAAPAGMNPAMMNAAMAGMSGMGGMGGNMGMDPAMMSNLMQSPMFQQMMGAMAQNPQLMAQMMQSNPMVQQMASQNPQMAALLQNPQMLQTLMNPQMIQAALQMQQAMNQFQPPQGVAAASAPAGAAAVHQQPGSATGQPNYGAMMAAMQNNPMFAQMLQGEGQGGMPMPAAALAEFEQRYATEIAQLEAMGFHDRAANIEALRVCDGNVELAINYLFDLGGGM